MILFIIYCRPFTFIGVVLCCPFYSISNVHVSFLPNNAIYRNFDCKIVERKKYECILYYNIQSNLNSKFNIFCVK